MTEPRLTTAPTPAQSQTPAASDVATPGWHALAEAALRRLYPDRPRGLQIGAMLRGLGSTDAEADIDAYTDAAPNAQAGDDAPADDKRAAAAPDTASPDAAAALRAWEIAEGLDDIFGPDDIDHDIPMPSGTPAAEVMRVADIATALAEGDDPWAADSVTGTYRPPYPVETGTVLALAQLARTLGTQSAVDALLSDGAATVLVCDSTAEANRLRDALMKGLRRPGARAGQPLSQTPIRPDVVVLNTRTATGHPLDLDRVEDKLADPAPLVILTPPGQTLPGALQTLPVIHIARPCVETLTWTLRLTHSATGQIAADTLRAALPSDSALASLSMTTLDLALRQSGPLRVARKLADLARPQRVVADDGPTLADLPGLGDAGQTLRQIAADLNAFRAGTLPWSDVASGVLLTGAPGTGKTFAAAAFARAAGVPLVTATLGEWQATVTGRGHDMMRAMAKSFDTAKAAASGPAKGAVLFIDEIDAIPSRDGLADHNATYYHNVTDTMLNHLDGAIARDGVIVIGATNYPERLDSAMVRPGRLGLRIDLHHPKTSDLTDVLRYHLRDALPGANLTPVARAAAGATMADIKGLVQAARQTARAKGRDLSVSDLMAALRDHRPPVSQALRHRVAISGAAKAVVAHVTGSARPDRLSLTVAPDVIAHVALTPRPDARTRADLGRDLITLLAGRAAEDVILGSISGRSGGNTTCDLAQATRLAIATELSFGREPDLIWCSAADDPILLFARHRGLRARVARRLDAAYARACDLVRAHRVTIEVLASDLLVDGIVTADALRTSLRDGPPEDDDWGDDASSFWPGL
ncbi:AAA family ATPase [Loktanella sp. SALINAS62]|uniref:AAA family ATPase n=1 Tax=Loktanella sp. SALINAS62 TaxID=2706124 RepID=UPI001B8C67B9|nr:AAA family ATPase [Loktanella sp. SALINAS62]MBS1301995.1 AAA family ATPase [Loktanella sp. SALINAS62]